MSKVLSDSQFAEKMKHARAKNASMTSVEKEAGFAPPQRCDLHCHLRTVEAALECGVRCRDWDAVCEGIALLQDAIGRTTGRKLHA